MAYVESHQELRGHPKLKRAARRAQVSEPTLAGHLHFLWHWALDHAADGDLSDYEPEDIADAAMWDGDPEVFVGALVDCGPGDKSGFLDRVSSGLMLHDWDEYGGKYARRVQAAKKAAAARWNSDSNADVMRSHSEGSADAVHPAMQRREEESTEEERTTTSAAADGDVSNDARRLTRIFAQAVKANGHPMPRRDSKAAADWLVEMDRLLRLGPPGEGGHVPTPDEVEQVISWATADEFERSNVKSVPKLRKRWSDLRLKAQRDTANARTSSLPARDEHVPGRF